MGIGLVAAFNAKDAAKVASFYADAATVMPPNAPAIHGRQDIEAFFKGGIDGGITNFQLTPAESAAGGSQAFEAGSYSMTISAPNGAPALTDRGKYVMILRRTGGTWKIVYDIFNSDLPPAAPPK